MKVFINIFINMDISIGMHPAQIPETDMRPENSLSRTHAFPAFCSAEKSTGLQSVPCFASLCSGKKD